LVKNLKHLRIVEFSHVIGNSLPQKLENRLRLDPNSIYLFPGEKTTTNNKIFANISLTAGNRVKPQRTRCILCGRVECYFPLEQWKYIKWAGREWALREDLRKEHHED
jgi:hypothetical protein